MKKIASGRGVQSEDRHLCSLALIITLWIPLFELLLINVKFKISIILFLDIIYFLLFHSHETNLKADLFQFLYAPCV
jgi:hypothetical protein